MNYKYVIPLQFSFPNPTAKLVKGRSPYYNECAMYWCPGNPQVIQPGQTFTFTTPSSEVYVYYQCNPDPRAPPCQEVLRTNNEIGTCQCNHTMYFSDDFNEYTVMNALDEPHSPGFFNSWAVTGTIDIKGFLPDGETPSANFFYNPCKDESSCVDIDGTMSTEPLENELSMTDLAAQLESQDSFYNRICTMNFWVSGNRRCGDLHPFDYTQRNKYHCVQFYAHNDVPLSDDLTVGIRHGDQVLGEVLFADIPWNQTWEAYGITVDAPYNGSVAGYFVVDSGKLNDGGNIGPLLDDVDMTCCCPDPDDRYVSEVFEYHQGLTGNNTLVPAPKSHPDVILGHGPKYPTYPQIYALGLGGWVTYKFDLGVSEYVTIYEESFVSCCTKDYEDATVEVSVDGINWVTVGDTFVGKWQVYTPAYDNSVRYATFDLPRGACYQYIRITDQSIPDCDASDGFDLHAIVVGEPCCGTPAGTFEVQLPGTGGTAPFEITTITPAAGIMFAIAAVGAIALGLMTVLSVSAARRERRMSEASILEPKLDLEEESAAPKPVATKKELVPAADTSI